MTFPALPTLHRWLKSIRWGDNPRRSLWICAGGAVVGLGIAGFGLFTANGTTTNAVPAEAAAIVNQKPVQRSDLVTQVETDFGVAYDQSTPQQRRQTLDDMIREELFVQRALELDVPATDADVRLALKNGLRRQIGLDAYVKKPTEGELRAFFARNAEKYSSDGIMSLVDLTAPNGQLPALQRALAELQQGTPLDAVSKKGGLQIVNDFAGKSYYFQVRLRLHDRLFASARGLAAGQSVIATAEDGAPHLLVMRSHERPVIESFEKDRATVLTDYLNAEAQRLMDGEARYLKKRADIHVAADLR